MCLRMYMHEELLVELSIIYRITFFLIISVNGFGIFIRNYSKNCYLRTSVQLFGVFIGLVELKPIKRLLCKTLRTFFTFKMNTNEAQIGTRVVGI